MRKNKQEAFSDKKLMWCIVCTVALYFLSAGLLHDSDFYPWNPKVGPVTGYKHAPKDRPPFWHWEYPR